MFLAWIQTQDNIYNALVIKAGQSFEIRLNISCLVHVQETRYIHR